MNKICTICDEEKDETEFVPRKGYGTRNQCKRCINKAAKISRDKTRSLDPTAIQELDWRRNLMRVYKITPEVWQEMFDKQGGVCYYCGRAEREVYAKTGAIKRLAVDHDWKCCPSYKSCGNCIRCLACGECNRLIGRLERNPLVLKKMLETIGS